MVERTGPDIILTGGTNSIDDQLISTVRTLIASAKSQSIVGLDLEDIRGLFYTPSNGDDFCIGSNPLGQARSRFASAEGNRGVPLASLASTALQNAAANELPGKPQGIFVSVRASSDYQLRIKDVLTLHNLVHSRFGEEMTFACGAWCSEDYLAPGTVAVDVFSVRPV